MLYWHLPPHFFEQTRGWIPSWLSAVTHMCYGVNHLCHDLRNELPHMAPPLGPAQAALGAQCPDLTFQALAPGMLGVREYKQRLVDVNYLRLYNNDTLH